MATKKEARIRIETSRGKSLKCDLINRVNLLQNPVWLVHTLYLYAAAFLEAVAQARTQEQLLVPLHKKQYGMN
jgi:hypothetical protein